MSPDWLEQELTALTGEARQGQPAFSKTLAQDKGLAQAIGNAFRCLSANEARMVRQSVLDELLSRLASHLRWKIHLDPDPRLPRAAQRGREYLHAHLTHDIGLDDLSAACGVDRFRLTRAFTPAFGLAHRMPILCSSDSFKLATCWPCGIHPPRWLRRCGLPIKAILGVGSVVPMA